MPYAIRVYDLKPHTLAAAEQHLAEACAPAVESGDLLASLHTEIGPLNRVIQVWGVADAAARRRVGAAAADAGAAIAAFTVASRAEVFVPFPCSPPFPAEACGPFFEIRRYRYAPGELPKIVAAWEAALPARLRHGPLVLVGSAEAEGTGTMIHIWPYRSLDERWQLRSRLRASGVWPPPVAARKLGLPGFELLAQENAIAVAAAFSPLQ